MPLMVGAVYFKTNCRVVIITPTPFYICKTELQEHCASCRLVKVKTEFERLSAWVMERAVMMKSEGQEWSPHSLTSSVTSESSASVSPLKEGELE